MKPYSESGAKEPDGLRVGEISDILYEGVGGTAAEKPTVRTQIYLTPREHAFLQREAGTRGDSMAGVIRRFIDEKIELPQDAWESNSMLAAPAHDPAFDSHPDDSINSDHYIYGAPKRFKKAGRKWVPALKSE